MIKADDKKKVTEKKVEKADAGKAKTVVKKTDKASWYIISVRRRQEGYDIVLCLQSAQTDAAEAKVDSTAKAKADKACFVNGIIHATMIFISHLSPKNTRGRCPVWLAQKAAPKKKQVEEDDSDDDEESPPPRAKKPVAKARCHDVYVEKVSVIWWMAPHRTAKRARTDIWLGAVSNEKQRGDVDREGVRTLSRERSVSSG
eukprot:4411956-Amphidinium_carterae.1